MGVRYQCSGGDILIDLHNRRMKVLDYTGGNLDVLVQEVKETAQRYRLSKIIFQAKQEIKKPLLDKGFVLEGIIPAFFAGQDCFCLSYFLTEERQKSDYISKEEEIINEILNAKKERQTKQLPPTLSLRPAGGHDVKKLVQLYQEIFTSYPSPLLNEAYVRSVINKQVYFMAVFDGEKLVSAASAEIDQKNNNAEITDCATLPEYRGKGLLTALITALEKEMWQRNLQVLCSFARAGSYGMNAVLHKLNYRFTGRMINNCHIAGRFEDMNIWVKEIGNLKTNL